VRTRVGYAGGSTDDPTYHDLADHTEAFALDFDPRIVSYGELLAEFWRSHQPERTAYSRQYMAAVFAATPAQAALARDQAAALGRDVKTPIIAGARFWLAEDYHQKYYLRHDTTLMRELAGYTPAQLVDSTVAARLNGYVAGRGSPTQLREDLATFGLSHEASAHLERLVEHRHRRA
jgi:peptide-methionine (S)-S-oxide reductase